MKEIPESIYYLNKLRLLNWSFNKIKYLPSEINALGKLEFLNISNDEVNFISDNINLKNLHLVNDTYPKSHQCKDMNQKQKLECPLLFELCILKLHYIVALNKRDALVENITSLQEIKDKLLEIKSCPKCAGQYLTLYSFLFSEYWSPNRQYAMKQSLLCRNCFIIKRSL